MEDKYYFRNYGGWVATKEWIELTSERYLKAKEKIQSAGIDADETEKIKMEMRIIDDVRRDISFVYSELNIPDGVDEIPDHMFDFSIYRNEYNLDSCSGFTDLKIYKIRKIGAFAFCCNDKLNDIYFSRDLETIERGAFKMCKIKGRVDIPESVKVIEEGAFEDCEATIVISDYLYKKYFKDSKSWDRKKTKFIVEKSKY